MHRALTVTPRGDSLCLSCAFWLAIASPGAARQSSRRTRRLFHSQSRLRQSSQTVTAHNTTSGGPKRAHDDTGKESAGGGWGGSGGWGGDSTESLWTTETRVLGKKPPEKPAQSVGFKTIRRAAVSSGPRQEQRPSPTRSPQDQRHTGTSAPRIIAGRYADKNSGEKRLSLSQAAPSARANTEATARINHVASTKTVQEQMSSVVRPPLSRTSLDDNGNLNSTISAHNTDEAPGHLMRARHPRAVPSQNPAVERLKAAQTERLRKAEAGELTGWGGATQSWGSRGKVQAQPAHGSGSQDTVTKSERKASAWDANPSFSTPSSYSLNLNAPSPTEEQPPRTVVAKQQGNNDSASSLFEQAVARSSERVRRRDRFALPGASSDRHTSRHKERRPARSRQDDEEENMSEELIDRLERREKRRSEREKRKTEAAPTPILLPDFISIGNLAAALRVRPEQFATKLEELGFEDFSNDHVIGAEDAGLIAQEFNFEPTVAPKEVTQVDLVAAPEPSAEDNELMLNRPPVITIMGHVDHGKTTLLDFLRKSSVAAGEHGGITQHIGAFTVEMPSGRTITFLDTPGHSAFLEMRQRGANVTDIVILVVAADDSVKPQTLEAIKHAKGAGVPIIVAISKCDKEQADPDRVKRDLAQHGVEVEDFGGDVQAIPVSGKTGQGMEDLEDAAVALADILDVRADTFGQVEGWVLESKLKAQGRVATVLMKRGTLRPGVILVAGTTWTRVRTLRNEAGQEVTEALPGQPVEVDGWDDTPEAGAEALEAPNMQRARQVCELRENRKEAEKLAAAVAATNEQREEHRTQRNILKEQQQLAKMKDVDEDRAAELQAAAELAEANATSKFIRAPIIVRADVAGSAEAVSAAVLAMGNSEIRALILREEVGTMTESDVELADISRGVIVNFGLTIPPEMRRLADAKGVKVIDGNVIYRITDAVKEHLEDRLPPVRTTRVLGEAEIAQVFNYKIKGRGNVPIAGSKVTNGIVEKGKAVKILRGGEAIYDGTLISLKNHKRDVDSMQKGTECGVGFEKFTEFEVGDKIQSYEINEEKRKL